MHPCLCVAELFAHILEELGEVRFRSVQTTLAALARTCKAFEDSSLNRLWYEQYHLENIAFLLPSKPYKANHNSQQRRLSKPQLVEAGVARIDFYTRRIHSFRICNVTTWETAELTKILSSRGTSDPLFPRLTRLNWMKRCRDFREGEFEKLLNGILRSSPRIQILSALIPITTQISNVIKNCVHIRELDLKFSDAPYGFFSVAASLPQLEILSVQFPSEELDEKEWTVAETSHCAFPALTSLSLSAGKCTLYLQEVAPILTTYLPRSLKKLELHDCQTDSIAELSHFFEILASLLPARSLEELYIQFSFELPMSPYKKLTRSDLASLLTFPHLRTVHLQSLSGIQLHLDDGDLDSFTSAWPLLSSIYLGDPYRYQLPDQPLTMQAFKILITQCPMLQSVRLAVNIGYTELAPLRLEMSTPCCSLLFGYYFKLPRSATLEKVQEVSQYFTRLLSRPITAYFEWEDDQWALELDSNGKAISKLKRTQWRDRFRIERYV